MYALYREIKHTGTEFIVASESVEKLKERYEEYHKMHPLIELDDFTPHQPNIYYFIDELEII